MQYLSNMLSDLILHYYKENKELCQLFSQNFQLYFYNLYIPIDLNNYDFDDPQKEVYISIYSKFINLQTIEYILDITSNE